MACFLKDNATCCYGLYKKNGLCSASNTLGSLRRTENNVLRVFCLVFGVITFAASVRKLRAIHRCQGSTIQKHVYSLMVVSALTFVARAPDPRSHERIYSPLVSGLIVDVCTAAIYTVMVLYAIFYVRLLAHPTTLAVSEHYIRGYQWLTIGITWILFGVVRPAYLLVDEGNIFFSWHMLIQFSIAPLLLLGLSSTAFYFGLQVHRRLVKIQSTNERLAMLQHLRQHATSELHAVLGPIEQSPSPIFLASFHDDHMDVPPMYVSSSNSTRVWRVMILMELCSIINVVFQVVLLAKFVSNGCQLKQDRLFATIGIERLDRYTFDWPTFTILQAVALCVIYWSFRKTKLVGNPTEQDPVVLH